VARAAKIVARKTDMGDYDLVSQYFVKLLDTWRIAGPLDEACNTEEAAVSDNRHDIEAIVDVVERVAINQNEVSDRSHRDPAEERISAECCCGVDAGGTQHLLGFQPGGDPCAKLGVQREAGRQAVIATAQLQ
jgi:hypothetical protein